MWDGLAVVILNDRSGREYNWVTRRKGMIAL